MIQTMFEKLQLAEERNLLIQGLPSSIEKQFSKVAYAKNVTPLLKSRKIDFALVFAINQNQLNGILREVLPALDNDGKLWVAYPKTTSKIASDLNRDCSWNSLSDAGYEGVRQVALDHVWSALRFKRVEQIKNLTRISITGKHPEIEGVDFETRTVSPPADLDRMFAKNKSARAFFDSLSFTNKKEYISWITSARREETRRVRVETAIEKMLEGKKNPSEK
jgi:Bacteriocin-protection, YdeI or OmpD-Associated